MRTLLSVVAVMVGLVAVPAQRPGESSIPSGSVGASDYQAIGDPRVDTAAFAAALADLNVTFTRVWLLDAWATGTGETGTYDGVLPVGRAADGRWDLDAWNDGYFTRVRAFASEMNRHGITPVFTLLELYSWSDAKQPLLWVPDQSRGLFRHNINGVYWGRPDDETLARLPDDWLRSFSCRVISALRGTRFSIELGNEMPDAAMHRRLARHLRDTCGYDGEIAVNRNGDTPNIFAEMEVGRLFDRLSIHGAQDLAYLDVEHDVPGPHTTFRALFDSGIDMSRITLSSDGARASTNVERAYDYDGLREVALDILRRGGSYEHQLAIKLRRFTDGRYDLDDLRYDAGFVRSLTARTASTRQAATETAANARSKPPE